MREAAERAPRGATGPTRRLRPYSKVDLYFHSSSEVADRWSCEAKAALRSTSRERFELGAAPTAKNFDYQQRHALESDRS